MLNLYLFGLCAWFLILTLLGAPGWLLISIGCLYTLSFVFVFALCGAAHE